jgi:hypothetical protein
VPNETSSEHQPKNVCRQKISLFEAYLAANEQHSSALADLRQKIGTLPRMEYVVLYRAIEILRKDAADLREELEYHVKQHGC